MLQMQPNKQFNPVAAAVMAPCVLLFGMYADISSDRFRRGRAVCGHVQHSTAAAAQPGLCAGAVCSPASSSRMRCSRAGTAVAAAATVGQLAAVWVAACLSCWPTKILMGAATSCGYKQRICWWMVALYRCTVLWLYVLKWQLNVCSAGLCRVCWRGQWVSAQQPCTLVYGSALRVTSVSVLCRLGVWGICCVRKLMSLAAALMQEQRRKAGANASHQLCSCGASAQPSVPHIGMLLVQQLHMRPCRPVNALP